MYFIKIKGAGSKYNVTNDDTILSAKPIPLKAVSKGVAKFNSPGAMTYH